MAGVALATMLLLPAACGGGGATPSWVEDKADGCGLRMFSDDACEVAVDRECCVHQQRCADDPDCRKLAECWFYCAARRHSDGCGCTKNCTPDGLKTAGWPIFSKFANCTKFVRYPEQGDCGGC
jgi:hypothetical protein